MLTAERRLITQTEAARLAGVNRATIWEWMRRGLLTTHRRVLDGRKMVDRDELLRKIGYEPETQAADE